MKVLLINGSPKEHGNIAQGVCPRVSESYANSSSHRGSVPVCHVPVCHPRVSRMNAYFQYSTHGYKVLTLK